MASRPSRGSGTEWAREPDFGGRWRSLGDHFGITGFGVNANEADAGRELIVPHTETEYGGQEELYLMLSGRARFTARRRDGRAGRGRDGADLARGCTREAVALVDGTLVLCVGGTPGQAYSPS